MKNTKTLSLEEFKAEVKNNASFADRVSNSSDIIDLDNGSMTIHRKNLNKYLEKYLCKSEDDFENTMWYSYGVFVRIVD